MRELSLKSVFRAGVVAIAFGVLAGCGSLPEFDYFGPSAEEQREARRVLRLADAARDAGDPAGAARLYRRAATQGAPGAEPWIGLGGALLSLSRPQEAVDAFETAIEQSPEVDADAERGLGRAYLALRRPHVALEHLEAAVAAAPNDPRGYNALGVAHDLAGRHRDALQAYEAGLAVDRANVSLKNNLGLSLALAGDTDRAIRLLSLLARSPDGNERHRQNLALAYALSGDTDRAAEIARLDLDERAVQQNLAYYAALAAMEGDRRRNLALAGATSPTPSESAEVAAMKAKALESLELAGDAVGFAPASSSGRWFVYLGRANSKRGAEALWRRLQQTQPNLFAALNRLQGVQEGLQPILAGPVANEGDARALCARAAAASVRCEPRRI